VTTDFRDLFSEVAAGALGLPPFDANGRDRLRNGQRPPSGEFDAF
jgi:hypothetical protein